MEVFEIEPQEQAGVSVLTIVTHWHLYTFFL